MALSNRAKRYVKEVYRDTRRKVKKVVLAAPFWVLLAALVMTGTGIGRYIYLTGQRYDQNMASYWINDSETLARHMSVYSRGARYGGDMTPPIYISQSVSLSKSDIITIRTSLQNFVDSSSGVAGKTGLGNDGRPRGWEDCYSSYLSATVDTVPDPNSETPLSFTSTCDIIAIDGNYPVFHPFTYLSGGFLPEIVEDARQIVLNDVLAWKFYKSYDIIGNKVKLWGEEFTVIGVVSEPSDRIAISAAGGEIPRAYVYFSAMEDLAPLTAPSGSTDNSQSDSGGSSSNTAQPTTAPASAGQTGSADPSAVPGSGSNSRPVMAVLCYEAMLPEIIKGVAKTDMSSSVPNYNPVDQNFYVLSNTGRFNVWNVWKLMSPIGQFESSVSDFDFPFWEKTAQLATEHLYVDEWLTISGVVLLGTGSIMAILRFRKMSRK